MPKKVLITYATGGMGHVMAAKAIQQAFQTKYPEVEIENIDVIDYAAKLYQKIFVNGYHYVSAKQPELWGWLYRGFNKRSRQRLPNLLSRLAIEGKFIPFIQKFNPDFIVATHPLPMILISHSKRKDVIDILSSMVVTDFGCHSFWVDPEVNYYFVATNDVGRCLQNYQVRPKQIVVTGIPIELKFSQPLDKKVLTKKLGLQPDLFTLLIVGGQFTFSSLKKIIKGIQKNNDNVQFIIVAGRDKDLKQALESSNFPQNYKVKIFGFVNNMEELMTVADLIFSKAGGLTVAECLAKGLPMIINKVIPGQEENNVNYLVNHGAAVKTNGLTDIIKVVNNLLVAPEKIKAMQKVCQKLGQPKAAINLADFVYKKIHEK